MNSACHGHSGKPAESTLWNLSLPAPLYSIIIMIDGTQSEIAVWGHVMAIGACSVCRCSRRVGHQVAASGLRVFLEHTVPVALQAWLAEHLSVMCRPTGWADPQRKQPAKWTSYAHECPSGICGLMSLLSQSDSFLAKFFFQSCSYLSSILQ